MFRTSENLFEDLLQKLDHLNVPPVNTESRGIFAESRAVVEAETRRGAPGRARPVLLPRPRGAALRGVRNCFLKK